jgi:hypothetical protein
MKFWGLILIWALLGCKSKSSINQSSLEYQNNAVLVERNVQLDTIRIPADTVKLTVPVSVLLRDTIIQLKNNVATSTITINKGQFTAMAVCDSLEKMVVSYQQQTTILKHQLSQKSTQETTIREPKGRAYPFFAGLLIGTILVIGVRLALRSLLL